MTPKQKTYRLPDGQSGLYELRCELTHKALLTVTAVRLLEGKEVYRRVFGPVSYHKHPPALPDCTGNGPVDRLLKQFYRDFLENCQE
jgi:hypothetical protein